MNADPDKYTNKGSDSRCFLMLISSLRLCVSAVKFWGEL